VSIKLLLNRPPRLEGNVGRVRCVTGCGGEVARGCNNVHIRAEDRVGLGLDTVPDIPQG